MLRFDNGIIQTLLPPYKSHQGHLRLDGIATRVGVFEYRDRAGKIVRELRHPEDVLNKDSLATLGGVPVTIKHPPVRVTTKNFATYGVGTVGDEIDASDNLYVRVKLNLQKEDAIAKVTSGLRELSCGYDCDVVDESGEYITDSGEILQYDKRQTNIRYNHLALVDFARAGRNARVRFDSEDFAEQEEIIKPPPTIVKPELQLMTLEKLGAAFWGT